MKPVPHVIINCAMSLDGYLNDNSGKRLLMSNKADFERVDKLREESDAILVGANTIRKDNPSLIIKSNTDKQPIKITLTRSGNISLSSNFFKVGDSEKIVYTTNPSAETFKKLAYSATVVELDEQTFKLRYILEDLYTRGIRKLLVEGGSSISTQFMQENLVDELYVAIAGFFVGQKNAPQLVQSGTFPWNANNRMHLESVKKLDEIAVLHYLLNK